MKHNIYIGLVIW